MERAGDDNVTVAWLKGAWKGVWREWMVKKGKSCLRYKSVVPLRSLILWDFSLTSKGRLRRSTIDELRKKYEELDSSSL
ncbi:hypothetical protein HOLleu_10159 [Holothuria leucospilota]|uniref:Uncharacterized protein n=1 Tax=Holothuria leucospilota TaxID=206669 RepID=A0A9Q1CDY3_HOLLE|nr:hypothetical protein HOLleu_10159 [Holothuria leucospilota]